MGRYVDQLDNLRAANRNLMRALYLVVLLALYALYGWTRAPERLRIDVPPSLQTGGSLKPGEHYPPNIYAFAVNIWQQVNRWPQNGEKDFGPAIYRMAPYLTPYCQDKLTADLNAKANVGELSGRTRSVQEMLGVAYTEDRVTEIEKDKVWQATVDLQVMETSHGLPVKDVFVRYPLRVVRYEVDHNANPWGLALDCWAPTDEPQRLTFKKVDRPPLPDPDATKIRSAADVAAALQGTAASNTAVTPSESNATE